eukprot:TRINITY_DN4236_c1_g2_i1.p1 TRINITY_DN4236_c1_g2~~TRINITY_DN4236_c1_g2_i1.p1  ORF type:complete len:227 (+),score=45.19 TRINITY_DN4236_c1_g2_i1:48-683(+)
MVNYSKWDNIGDSEDEEEKEQTEHKLNVYRSLHKESQELFDYASAGALDLVKDVLAKGAFINSKLPQNGNTALHMSIWLQHQDVAEYLIQKGADCEVKDNDGCRPIHTAAWAAFEGDPKTLRLLLEKCVELEPTSNTGNTPLHFAASASDECVRLLLEAGANPLAKNNDGLTPRQYGEKKGFGGSMKRKQAQIMYAELEAAEQKYLEKSQK